LVPDEIRSVIRESGLVGRGGGEFPLSRKLDTAVAAPGEPFVVVNASEGEPASRKDATLLLLRPHLVLDGAQAVASAVGASEIVVYVHRGSRDLARVVGFAIEERKRTHAAARVVIAESPDRYVAGESSAVVSFLDRGVALPRRSRLPAAHAGVAGRPTIVSNTETYAHVALIVRFGSTWFKTAGSPGTPGSTLVTLAGAVSRPGTVVEVVRPVSFASLLAGSGGVEGPPRAVLLGGYAGTWVDGRSIWATSLDRDALRNVGASMGCGLVAPLGHDACGLAETARLFRWLATESAGQCGPCVSGLPAVADLVDLLADGRARSRDISRIHRLAVAIRGRGACGHPTGAIELLESALDTFPEEMKRHLRGERCKPLSHGLPLSKTRT
jgi:NADH:ubiquinone oxidoreductase subunit F (NADH-binding)